jgi:hypothetical protein
MTAANEVNLSVFLFMCEPPVFEYNAIRFSCNDKAAPPAKSCEPRDKAPRIFEPLSNTREPMLSKTLQDGLNDYRIGASASAKGFRSTPYWNPKHARMEA